MQYFYFSLSDVEHERNNGQNRPFLFLKSYMMITYPSNNFAYEQLYLQRVLCIIHLFLTLSHRHSTIARLTIAFFFELSDLRF